MCSMRSSKISGYKKKLEIKKEKNNQTFSSLTEKQHVKESLSSYGRDYYQKSINCANKFYTSYGALHVTNIAMGIICAFNNLNC